MNCKITAGLSVSGMRTCRALCQSLSLFVFLSIFGINLQAQCEVDAGTISTSDPTEICAGDGIGDPILVDVVGASASEQNGWVITNPSGVILGLPPGPPFDLEGAGQGTCLIWHLVYDGELNGVEVGAKVEDLVGCFDFSNAITVRRTGVTPATISTSDDTDICTGDGANDFVDVSLEGRGEFGRWVITDSDGNILGLPAAPPFNFEGAGQGTCLIWFINSTEQIKGLSPGQNVSVIDVCHALSNPITINRTGVDGGKIKTSGNRYICAGDGESDSVEASVSGNVGEGSAWVITDTQGNILGLPEVPPFDFEGAGGGVCVIWHLSFNGALTGLVVGENVADIEGCYDFSNSVKVTRRGVDGGEISTDDPTSFCVGDGSPNFVTPMLSGEEGSFGVWIITDDMGNMLTFPKKFPVDFEGAGEGVCQIWFLSYEFGLKGIGVGNNVADLSGCFDFSNPITITRSASSGPLEGGTISTSDPTEICAGDGIGDPIDVEIVGAMGVNMGWVITDVDGMILGIPPGPPFDLDGAGTGVCLIWHISYEDGLAGVEVGSNAKDLQGCFSLSNPITVTRTGVADSQLEFADGSTEVSICAGDGNPDPLDVNVSGGEGENSAWVITDPQGVILGLPPGPPFDLDGAGAGTCLIWNLWYSGDLSGVAVGLNANDLIGCHVLSNPLTVTRTAAPAGLSGGTISTNNPTEICAGDGVPDPIGVTLEGDGGTNSAWVITDVDGMILGLPPGPPFDLEGAGTGVCLIWHLSFEDGLIGAEVGLNANDLEGCYSLSNAITVTRKGVQGGTLTFADGSDKVLICSGDGMGDPLEVNLEGNEGESSAWVITDPDGIILGLPAAPPFDLDEAGEGTCLIWSLSYNGDLTGVAVGQNAFEVTGCRMLSNAIRVDRQAAPDSLAGGTISTEDPTEICAGDGVGDPINVTLAGAVGMNSGWVITDTDGNILGLPAGPPFDLDGAGTGVCLIWHISFEDGIRGVAVGANASDLQGCYSLSNSIQVIRTGVSGGNLEFENGGTETMICAGDGEPDPLNVTLTVTEGSNSGWVITDPGGMILGLPAGPPFDLDGAGAGTCLIWHISYEDGLTGADVGQNAMDLAGCFSLSNPLTVVRDTMGAVCGGMVIERSAATTMELEIFPNPTRNILYFKSSSILIGVDISIIDAAGRIVENKKMDKMDSGQVVKIDIHNIDQGFYFFRVQTNEGVQSRSFIKE